jgi:DNA invertase Pin-like site-specific DNA recombinase
MINALVVRQNTQLAKIQRRLLAAQYVRMSTEKQRYSIQNQAAAIASYAHAHNLTIVRTYSDEGESGLNIKNRAGLTKLIEDVRSGQTDFGHLLVYDVSRWGRFQDIDESAYYEFICKQAGIKVAYCAEQFDNDGSLLMGILKNLKRVMAAEYSRELSAKVLAGTCRISGLGFRMGARTPYGLRRELVDENRHSRGLLEPGQHKFLKTDHIVLTPGPAHEQQIVREIFRRFAVEKWSEVKIARQLNEDRVPTLYGTPWTNWKIHSLLRNECYIGNIVYNRRTSYLGQVHKPNPPEQWIRREGVFEAIVEPALFWRAQQRVKDRYVRMSNEEMLKALRLLLRKRGKLSEKIMDDAPGLPSAADYQLRFGSIRKAYRLVGYESTRDCSYIDTRDARAVMVLDLQARLIDALEQAGQKSVPDGRGAVVVNGRIAISLRVARCWQPKCASPIWTIWRRASMPDGLILTIRLDEANAKAIDYFVFPTTKMMSPKISFTDRRVRARFGAYQFSTSQRAIQAIVRRVSRSEALTRSIVARPRPRRVAATKSRQTSRSPKLRRSKRRSGRGQR